MTDEEIEALAIEANRTGWGQLFHRDSSGGPWGEFIAKRPYPTKFWAQIDTWVNGYKSAIK